jgi:tRNA threonylcarbamoyladenosine biosynthesis protein TsaE
LAKCISEIINPGDLLLLSGNLGTGKTAFTKALASYLGVDESEVTSPSFTLINEYREGKIPIIHADLYRLGSGVDISDLGIDEYLSEDCLIVVEWAEYMEGDFDDALWIKFKSTLDGNEEQRIISLEAQWQNWESRLREVETCFRTPLDWLELTKGSL